MALNDAKAVIFSVKGAVLSDKEAALFRDSNPLGFILFARNCENPTQLKTLVNALKDTVGWDCPILIDQEGGRVQRLKPPVWRKYPPMQHFGDLAAEDMDGALEQLRFTILQMADELTECGVNVNCAPVLDVLFPVTHDAIGDRAFSDDPEIVARLGASVIRHFSASGVTPIIKHIPGHGRGKVDSHKDLPCVLEGKDALKSIDFDTFRIVLNSVQDIPVWAMVAHIVYEQIDPDHPASVSPTIIENIIRKQIGFDGFLVSDDLGMHALKAYGDISSRVLATIEAGCDAALYCAGDIKVMEKIAKTVPNLTAKAQERLQNGPFSRNIAA